MYNPEKDNPPNYKKVKCCWNCKHLWGDYCECATCSIYRYGGDLDGYCDNYEPQESFIHDID